MCYVSLALLRQMPLDHDVISLLYIPGFNFLVSCLGFSSWGWKRRAIRGKNGNKIIEIPR